jgi:triosephosphate isomerase
MTAGFLMRRMARKPLALSNWKMAMTVSESLAFVRDFEAIAGDLLNRKVHLALDVGLAPILMIGEATDDQAPLADALEQVLAGCQAEQVEAMAFVYEPEGAIGVTAPASPEHVATGCGFIRGWLRGRWGDDVAESVRIIYGGSVAPEYAADLLACPDVDGLGATRRGRDAATFAQIVRLIVTTRSSLVESYKFPQVPLSSLASQELRGTHRNSGSYFS